MKAMIISTTDGKYIGDIIETDLFQTTLPNGELFEIDNRMKLLEGGWKLWNPNYILEIKEMEE